MGFPVYSTTALVDRLAALKASAYPSTVGAQATVFLYSNDVSPDANMSDITFERVSTEDIEGVLLTMGAITLNDQGMVNMRSNLVEWNTPAGADPMTVYGIVIMNFAATKVIAAQRFDEPQVLGGALPQGVAGIWRVSEPLSTMGWIDVEN